MNKNCYLLTGDDHYSIKERTNQIFANHELGLNDVEVYDYEEVGLHIALSNALTLPFLVDKKGVVIRNASFLKKQSKMIDSEIEDLMRYCDMMVKETILVIQAPYDQLDGQKKIIKYLKKNILVETFLTSNETNLYDYIKLKLDEKNIKIDAYALTQFINRINHDLDSVNNELNKLISYSNGIDHIDSDMIVQITSKDIDDNVFHLVNALFENDKSKLMDIYQDLKSVNTNEVWMISAITNRFLEILYTKSLVQMGYNQNDISKYFKVSSGRAYYMKKNAEMIRSKNLLQYIKSLADLDYQIKSGLIDKQLGIEMFLLSHFES